MKKTRVKVSRDKKWQMENNLILKKEKVYVFRDKELRTEV